MITLGYKVEVTTMEELLAQGYDARGREVKLLKCTESNTFEETLPEHIFYNVACYDRSGFVIGYTNKAFNTLKVATDYFVVLTTVQPL